MHAFKILNVLLGRQKRLRSCSLRIGLQHSRIVSGESMMIAKDVLANDNHAPHFYIAQECRWIPDSAERKYRRRRQFTSLHVRMAAIAHASAIKELGFRAKSGQVSGLLNCLYRCGI